MTATPPLLRPRWDAPAGVGAAMSLRDGGVSRGRWASLNLGGSVGDDADAVAENRARYAAAIGLPLQGLHQVHGTRVVRLTAAAAAAAPEADAAWTSEPGVACTVGAADCLPVLMALRDGSAVAAAHAGWRGLAAGVLEATLAALADGTGASAADVVAWLGPCIGPRRFEVGDDVLQAFGGRDAAAGRRFEPHRRADGSRAWTADLAGLAADRLAAAGVGVVVASGLCTVEDPSRFFSHRRDGVCGRHAASVWRG